MSARRVLFLALVFASTPAWAQATSVHDWVASFQLLAFASEGVEVQGEHYFAGHRLSVVFGAGAHVDANTDYAGVHASVAGELRAWLWQPGSWARLDGQVLGGLFALARIDVGYDTVSLRGAGVVGQGIGWQPTLGFGWRLIPGSWHVEVTPWLGGAYVAHLPLGETAPTPNRFAPVLGVTAGWIF